MITLDNAGNADVLVRIEREARTVLAPPPDVRKASGFVTILSHRGEAQPRRNRKHGELIGKAKPYRTSGGKAASDPRSERAREPRAINLYHLPASLSP